MDTSTTSSLFRQYRPILQTCFVCNLPILSHQVGLVWQGGNAWDELVREQDEESTVRQRLRPYKDLCPQLLDLSMASFAADDRIAANSSSGRRRSSLAQITDIFKEWRIGGNKSKSSDFKRRETLQDFSRTIRWTKQSMKKDSKNEKRRLSKIRKHSDESSPKGSIAHDLRMKVTRLWSKSESSNDKDSSLDDVNDFKTPIQILTTSAVSAEKLSTSPNQRLSNPSMTFDSIEIVHSKTPNKSDPTTPIHSPTNLTPPPQHETFNLSKPSSPERRLQLKRQDTIFDESSSSPNDQSNRRSSLSPDSAVKFNRYSNRNVHLSPERKTRAHKLQRRNTTLRYSFADYGKGENSPLASPKKHTSVRRQSTTTEEILIATGFRRQSTTEEQIRCRNFRRQSSQSDDISRFRKDRRDSSAQITDGTLQTMIVETSSVRNSTENVTEPSSTYDNNHYHEECLKCNSCGTNLTGTQQKRARRVRNQIFCDLHFADVALMECSDCMQQLRSFKPQSLGCAVARRKSSATLIFPLPPQACSDEFCEDYPHNLIPTPGYWIECSRRKTAAFDSSSILDDHEETKSNEDYSNDFNNLSFESLDKNYADSDKRARKISKEYLESPRKKTLIEEQWESNNGFELTSVEQETYEKYFYGREHWNYFTNDEDLGPVIMSIKQETLNLRDQFRVLIRAISYTVHGLIPASCVFADRYNREEVVRSLGKEISLNPPLILGQLPDTSEELLKLDQVFMKSELKVGVIYVRENQYTEEEILDNNHESNVFTEFLNLIGDRVQLKGFDRYKGGLDTVHDLTGSESVYTCWRNVEIMFHVSTMLPYEKHDPQKLQRKRHIGNDIVCVVFLEADSTPFSPTCIKSHFLHTFIIVRTSSNMKSKKTIYDISVITRDEVGAYKPYLCEQSTFEAGPMFREWILTKIVNAERASYSAPKFARMQERTRSQMLEDMVANLQNHVETGQIPKPYRRGSWRPIGHMRPSSPLLDSIRDVHEDNETLGRDFTKAFLNSELCLRNNEKYFDVVFLVGQSKEKERVYGVRALLGIRSRIFQEILYGIQTGFGSPQISIVELLSRPAPTLLSPKKFKNKNNFLQVPESDSSRHRSLPSSPIVKRAFSKLGTITSNWSKSIRKHGSQNQLGVNDKNKSTSSHESAYAKESKEKPKFLDVPKLSMCADIQKVDKNKLAQTEFAIIEFDANTFRILLDYLHTGSCPLSCVTIPGLICAAEHYDLPDLLQACFHHAKQFLSIDVVCKMLNSLENYYWRYTSASELVNMILAYVESRASQLFLIPDFISLNESMLQLIVSRNLEVPEIVKFEAILSWAKNRVKTKTSARIDPKIEFRVIMERLSRDIKLHLISPQDLIKIVLPSKAIQNEQILETLMHQANSGMYRINDSYFRECTQGLQKQDFKFSDANN